MTIDWNYTNVSYNNFLRRFALFDDATADFNGRSTRSRPIYIQLHLTV